MLFLKNIDMLVATSSLKLQKFGNFEGAYLLSKYLAYIMMLHNIKKLVVGQVKGIYI
jgi:hypothetical protein